MYVVLGQELTVHNRLHATPVLVAQLYGCIHLVASIRG